MTARGWGVGVALVGALAPALVLADDAGRPPGAELPTPTLPAVVLPTGWEAQPLLATAARDAAVAEAGARPVVTAAWGDPLRGCFATALAVGLRSGDTVDVVLAQLRTSLASAVAVDDWRAGAGVVQASFARPGWRGTLRGALVSRTDPHATFVACFHDDRAPARCQAACGALVGSLPAAFTLPTNPVPP